MRSNSLLRTARARSTASRPRPIGWSLIKTSRSFLDLQPFPPAAGTVTTPNKVLSVLGYCLCQPGEIDKTTPYSFLASDGSIESFYGTIKYLKKLYPTVKRVVLTNADDGSLPYLVPLFKKALQDEGLILAADLVPYSNDTQDFSPIAARLNATKDVDAVILCTGMATHFGSIVKGLRELGNQKPFFVSCGAICRNPERSRQGGCKKRLCPCSLAVCCRQHASHE